MPTQRKLLFIPLIMVLILSARIAVNQSWAGNAWSVQWLRFMMAGDDVVARPSFDPPGAHRRARLWIAEYLLSINETEKALNYLEKAPDNSFLSQRIRALALLSQGDYESALVHFEEAGDFWDLVQQGETFADMGDMVQAEEYLQAAQRTDPEMGTEPLASFLIDWGKPLAALELFGNAAHNYPDSARRSVWLLRQARILRQLGEWERSEAIITELLEHPPLKDAALIELGKLAYERGDGYEQSVPHLLEAVKHDPQSGRPQMAIASMLVDENRYREADEWFAAANTLAPETAAWMLAYAYNARRYEDNETAINRYQDITQKFPDDPAAYYELAWLYRTKNMPQKAVEAINAALGKQPRASLATHLRAALIFEWAGKSEEARAHYESVLSMDPAHPAAIDGLSRLDE